MTSGTNQTDRKNLFVIVLTFLFVYIVLFEFILPVNKILPKPSLLYESYISLWLDYGILFGAAVTTTVIYLSLLFGYLFVSLTSSLIIKMIVEAPGLFNAPRIFRYFPVFFFAILFVYWFGDSLIAELVFGFLISVFIYGLDLYKEIPNTKTEYINFAKSLGAGKDKIYSNIVWKSVQPALFNNMKNHHYLLWVMVLIYEFISVAGLGGIYNTALEYNDLAAMFALGILISILIMIGNIAIRFLKNKIIYWE